MDIQQITKQLNPEQQKAVLATEGPVLILAGAGSGKTRALVHRIAWLLDGIGVSPAQILAITFTNKAADEMRRRVDEMIGFGAEQIHVSTFHSLCVSILRREADLIGFTRYFSIYDTDDQKTLMKSLMKEKNIDSSRFNGKGILNSISSAKNELITPEKYNLLNKDFYGERVSVLYSAYQEKLRGNNAMDFDDLIMKTVEVFEAYPDVLNIYQERFRYIMVDEYQDTNTAQFRLVSLLAAKYRNLCVVGDDDQSIYKFRGATIRNILEFEDDYENTAVIRLEQNYRSTKTILSAANSVIGNNYERKSKSLWTENPQGDKITVYTASDDRDESDFIANDIKEKAAAGAKYSDFAVLYRMNNQSQGIERTFVHAGIPYRIIGGRRFYERREVRDMIAYLSVISNPSDSIRLKRILNIPKRGIGDKTISNIEEISSMIGQSMFDTMRQAEEFEVLEYVKSVSYPNSKARHLVEMARMLCSEFGGEVPTEAADLVKLPGVRRKTANVVQAVAFGKAAMAVDTHVFRVSHRLGLVPEKANTPLKVEEALMAHIPEADVRDAHHWLILHGRYVCTSRAPHCGQCPFAAVCPTGKNNLKSAPSSIPHKSK